MSRTLGTHYRVPIYVEVKQLRHPACPSFSLPPRVKRFQVRKRGRVGENPDKSDPCRNFCTTPLPTAFHLPQTGH